MQDRLTHPVLGVPATVCVLCAHVCVHVVVLACVHVLCMGPCVFTCVHVLDVLVACS